MNLTVIFIAIIVFAIVVIATIILVYKKSGLSGGGKSKSWIEFMQKIKIFRERWVNCLVN